jgi:hypothetical protein
VVAILFYVNELIDFFGDESARLCSKEKVGETKEDEEKLWRRT